MKPYALLTVLCALVQAGAWVACALNLFTLSSVLFVLSISGAGAIGLAFVRHLRQLTQQSNRK